MKYPKEKRYLSIKEGPYNSSSNKDHIQVQVLRAELGHAGPFINPIIKMRLGELYWQQFAS